MKEDYCEILLSRDTKTLHFVRRHKKYTCASICCIQRTAEEVLSLWGTTVEKHDVQQLYYTLGYFACVSANVVRRSPFESDTEWQRIAGHSPFRLFCPSVSAWPVKANLFARHYRAARALVQRSAG
jgi:hypothetical protein